MDNSINDCLGAFIPGEVTLHGGPDSRNHTKHSRHPAGREVEPVGIKLLDLHLEFNKSICNRAAVLAVLG